jgi:hypothetical protein
MRHIIQSADGNKILNWLSGRMEQADGLAAPRDLTTTFNAPPMFGKSASNILFDEFVFYVGFTPGIGPNGLIHQLRLQNDVWHHKELTSAAGAPRAFFALNAYVHNASETQHVVYLGLNDQGVLDNQVHELVADSSNDWHHNNLTGATGATLALTTPTGYEFHGIQHIVYQGVDSHILELWHDSNGWHVNDLTNAVVSLGPLTARNFSPTDSQHIPFLGAGGAHIQELYWYHVLQWRLTDLTSASGAPLAASEPTNYSFWQQGTQHINYLGTDGHGHELWWDYENGWQHNDLTNATGAPLGQLPSGYVFSEQGTQHVVYQGNEGHIHELWWDNSGWHHNDLTPGAPDALLAGGNPMGYAVGNKQHVIYTTRITNHVIELKWTPP